MQSLTDYLSARTYPGRGIILGLTQDEKNAVSIYFIMGRSENSRNRLFEKTPDGICTKPFDYSKMTDPSLIIYHPVREFENRMIVTNGDQTDTILSFLQKGSSFNDALLTRTYEPDEPNYTPRISGLLATQDGALKYTLSILRKDAASMDCQRDFYEYSNQTPGYAHILHTYDKDANPLPSFAGEPVYLRLPAGDVIACAQSVWDSLDANNRISLYACYWNLQNGKKQAHIINKKIFDSAKDM